MGMSRSTKPKIEHCRVDAPDFSELFDAIRFNGTHHMRNEWEWIKSIAIQTAAKSFNSIELRDNQEIFLTKISDLRYVNGYNDVDDLAFNEIQQLWHQVVMDMVNDFNEFEIFDYDHREYVLEINVGNVTERHIDLERILYKRARGPYD